MPTKRGSFSPELLARVRDWVEREIAFVDHPDYSRPDYILQIQSLRPASLDAPVPAGRSEPGVAFVTGLVDAPLLTAAEESYLFLWMNFLKFRAERSRQRLSLNSPDGSLLDRIDADLKEANEVRNRIVRSNLRLVVALARKLADSLDQMSELIGESTVPLIRAVELFNIGLGNRFSTYATWAVRNHIIRCLKRRQSALDRTAGEEPMLFDRLADQRTDHDGQVKLAAHNAEVVQQLLATLSDRERLILTARYGLDGQPDGQSLHEIAERIGLSKERVRQITIRAIARLHEQVPLSDD